MYHSTHILKWWKKASALCLNAVPTSSEIHARILKSNAAAERESTTLCTPHSTHVQQFKKGTEKYYYQQIKCNVL